jgi:hypothetical protein
MAYEYRGKEIVSELVINQNCKGVGKIKQSQIITVQCERCNNKKQVNYYGHVTNRLKSLSTEYNCHTCTASILTSNRNKNNKGKHIEEILGSEKGRLFRDNKRKYATENNIKNYFKSKAGLSWEELYGKKKADSMKQHHKNICKLKPMYGIENYQFGKPAHKLSGKGTKGYYKGTYFRSLMEVSFIINYLEKNNLIFENGELKKYSFKYIHNGRSRNYFCDFVVDDTFYEIKPKSLHDTIQNIDKWEAAQSWCKSNNKIFKVFSEKDYEQLSQNTIDSLIQENKLILI